MAKVKAGRIAHLKITEDLTSAIGIAGECGDEADEGVELEREVVERYVEQHPPPGMAIVMFPKLPAKATFVFEQVAEKIEQLVKLAQLHDIECVERRCHQAFQHALVSREVQLQFKQPGSQNHFISSFSYERAMYLVRIKSLEHHIDHSDDVQLLCPRQVLPPVEVLLQI